MNLSNSNKRSTTKKVVYEANIKYILKFKAVSSSIETEKEKYFCIRYCGGNNIHSPQSGNDMLVL